MFLLNFTIIWKCLIVSHYFNFLRKSKVFVYYYVLITLCILLINIRICNCYLRMVFYGYLKIFISFTFQKPKLCITCFTFIYFKITKSKNFQYILYLYIFITSDKYINVLHFYCLQKNVLKFTEKRNTQISKHQIQIFFFSKHYNALRYVHESKDCLFHVKVFRQASFTEFNT